MGFPKWEAHRILWLCIMKKIFKNASWIIVCKIIQSILTLIIGMITVRYLGPSNYGVISYAASITAFFTPLMRLGLTSTLVQEFVSDPDNEGQILGTSLLMNILSGVASVVGISTFCMIANHDEMETVVVCILYSFTLVFQAAEMSQYWFQAKMLSKYPSLAALVAYVVVSIYKIYVLVSDKSIYWFAITHVIEACIVAVVLMICYCRLSKHKISVSFTLGKKMLSKSKYYIISGMAVVILQSTDKIMLKNMISDEVTGYYSVAVTCTGIFSFVYTAIIDSMRPQILKQKMISNENYEEHISILYAIVFYMALAQGIATTMFAEWLVLLLYGESYLPAVSVLRISVWVVSFAFFGSIISIWILGEKKYKLVIPLEVFGAVINVLLNLLFIPSMGALGAALASLLSQFLKNFVFCIFIPPLRKNVVLMLRGIDPRFVTKQLKKMINKR